MTPERKRSFGVTIWMNQKEHAKVEAIIGEKPTGEALRDYLLEQANLTPLVELLMSELLVVQTLVANCAVKVSEGRKVDEAMVKDIRDHARVGVLERARKALRGAE